ncbi:MAG: TerC/Alx family metal homeostasis membrane protein [Terrimicrobiaceae bacterium]|nr:TerC/Alx family metal homeostasis membrane protein [Terrimicrobiaceae bacterium]
MDQTVLLWILFGLAAVGVSALDLFVITHRHSPVGVSSALRWTACWIAVAFGYAAAIHFLHPGGWDTAMLFVAGYLTEYALSVDNLFVFILIFSLMGVPEGAQPKLIKLGIYLSIVLRILFITFGIALVTRFHWLLYGFGALLIWTAWKMLTSEENENVRPDRNLLYRAASKCFRMCDPGPENRRLVVRSDGHLCITPLFLVFLVIGSTDILFALDSIPAIMGISDDPFVVITSNVFAVLGLNSLFFALRGVMGMFRFLKHGVSIILFFIGLKMIGGMHPGVEHWFKDHAFVSLLVIGLVLLVSIVLSVWHERTQPRNVSAKP